MCNIIYVLTLLTLQFYFQSKLAEWWTTLTGKRGISIQMIRQDGSWNKEIQLYHSLLGDKEKIIPINDESPEHDQNEAEQQTEKV